MGVLHGNRDRVEPPDPNLVKSHDPLADPRLFASQSFFAYTCYQPFAGFVTGGQFFCDSVRTHEFDLIESGLCLTSNKQSKTANLHHA